MIYSYARVSTRNQACDGYSLDSQIDKLKASGAKKIYYDEFTGKVTDKIVKIVEKIVIKDVVLYSNDRINATKTIIN